MSKHCVNCEHDYDDEDNYNGACEFHPGAYGRCGKIAPGNGWTCCGREWGGKPCRQGAHTTEFKRSASMIEMMEKFMRSTNNDHAKAAASTSAKGVA